MKIPAYLSCKSSGVEWLGDVPEHWEVKRGRFCMEVNPSSNRLRTLHPDDEVSFVPMESVGEYGGLNLDQTRAISEVGSGYTQFDDGDVVVAKITPCFENGKGALAAGLVNGAAFGTTELHVLRAAPTLDRRFLFYFTISRLFRSIGEGEMYGAGGQKRVPPEFCENVRIPLPPPDDQRTIADFLDRETAKIDTLVAKRRTLIKRLKEKRKALISRTVSRGLPPDAARAAGLPENPTLKPSGIDWLGDVPVHWTVTAVWHQFFLGRGRVISHEDINADPGDYPIYSSQTENEGVMGSISTYDFDGEYITWTTDGANAGTVFARQGRFNCTNVCGTLKAKNPARTDIKFVTYALSLVTAEFVRHDINPKLMNNVMKGIRVPFPPVEEQQTIADFLDRETAKIDGMVAKVETAIERLQEHRTALITAVVTGKIDVRGAVA